MNTPISVVRSMSPLVCVWLPSGMSRTSLACVWVRAETTNLTSIFTATSSGEPGGLRLCA